MIPPQSPLVCPLWHATENSLATRRSTGLPASVDRKIISRPETLYWSTRGNTSEQPVSAFNTTVPQSVDRTLFVGRPEKHRSTGNPVSVDRKSMSEDPTSAFKRPQWTGRPHQFCRSTGGDSEPPNHLVLAQNSPVNTPKSLP